MIYQFNRYDAKIIIFKKSLDPVAPVYLFTKHTLLILKYFQIANFSVREKKYLNCHYQVDMLIHIRLVCKSFKICLVVFLK